MRFFGLIALLTLTGCLTDQYAVCQAHQGWLARSECIDQIAATDSDLLYDPVAQEVHAYRKLLMEKVKAGSMTEAEAGYAFQLKKAEVIQRLERRIASQEVNQNKTPEHKNSFVDMLMQQQLINQQKQRTTNCQVIGNNIHCSTH